MGQALPRLDGVGLRSLAVQRQTGLIVFYEFIMRFVSLEEFKGTWVTDASGETYKLTTFTSNTSLVGERTIKFNSTDVRIVRIVWYP